MFDKTVSKVSHKHASRAYLRNALLSATPLFGDVRKFTAIKLNIVLLPIRGAGGGTTPFSDNPSAPPKK